ncbi:hypothetical transcriptional regulatory protein [Picrophilus oshimae DSM 9789]|uniref:Hypothetical transcriptional regulatory protein n=2 Tax=Picrophilus oshimae TaxID=46632 RepID=Q6KYT9_PICTO|nr:hypothetical transcriptional regulatory protein [Picrophilus oshimae DSM 9789]
MDLNISAQDLNYRMKKINEEGIIKKYMLHVNPAFYGKKSLYMAFSGDKIYHGRVSSVIKCLEKTTVYGLSGTDEELNKKSMEIVDMLGSPEMRYMPATLEPGVKRIKLDDMIIEQLRMDPLMRTQDIARALNKKYSTVKRRLDYLIEKRVISIIGKLDLSKLNTVILGIFTDRIKDIISRLDESLIIINDDQSGISLSIEKDIITAKSVIENLRKIDNKIEVMIIYDYEFFE